MIRALKARNKLGFADDTLPKPKNESITELKWEHANAVTCSWILGSISETIYSSHACSEYAQDIWTDLFETYHKADGFVIFNVHKKINSLTQSGSTLSEYFKKLDS